MSNTVQKWERERLRELARKQLEYAESELNQARIREWYLHNDLKGERPMVQLEMGTFEQEIIPQRLKCVTKEARELEAQLYRNFLNRELFDDDRVVPDFFPLSYDAWFRLFDIEVKVENAQLDGHQSLGHHFIPSLEDLESDYEEEKSGPLRSEWTWKRRQRGSSLSRK